MHVATLWQSVVGQRSDFRKGTGFLVGKRLQGETVTGHAWWPRSPSGAHLRHRSAWDRLLGARSGVHFAFGVAAVILAVVGWALFGALDRTRDAATTVNHTQRVLLALGEAREAFSEMESAQRGYLLGGGDQYLDERDRAAGEFRNAVRRVRSLVANNPEQTRRLEQFEELAQERIRVAVANAELRRSRGFAHPWSDDASLSTRQAMARVHALSRDMEDVELRLLQEQHAEEEQRQRHVILLLAAGLAAGLLLLAPAYGAVLHQSREREAVERQMTDLVEDLPVSVWQIRRSRDGNRAFVFVSASAEQARGLTVDQICGDITNVYNSVVDEDRPRLLAAMDESERSLDDFDCEYRIRMPDGGLRWIHSRASLRREGDGAVVWSGYWADVTQAKLLQRDLERSNEALEAFTYSVSHDLRAPLAAIEGFGRALQERASQSLDPRSEHFLARIRASTLQMNDLIEGMLQLGKVSQGNLATELVDLSALAEEVVAELCEREPSRVVQVAVEPSMRVWGDKRLLRQVVANLLGNAWKFTAKTAHASISFGAADCQSKPCFCVRDNGAGFDMAYAQRLFGTFQRLHSVQEFPGTGLGLATVQRILARHNGEVWAEAQPGQGATFYFTLPRQAG